MQVPDLYIRSIRSCLTSGEVDAVYVCVPNHLHREYAEAAARNRVHVLYEKPLAPTRTIAAIIRTARTNNVQLRPPVPQSTSGTAKIDPMSGSSSMDRPNARKRKCATRLLSRCQSAMRRTVCCQTMPKLPTASSCMGHGQVVLNTGLLHHAAATSRPARLQPAGRGTTGELVQSRCSYETA
jgi:GFO/IDH/MocA oxidoreductase family protein